MMLVDSGLDGVQSETIESRHEHEISEVDTIQFY